MLKLPDARLLFGGIFSPQSVSLRNLGGYPSGATGFALCGE